MDFVSLLADCLAYLTYMYLDVHTTSQILEFKRFNDLMDASFDMVVQEWTTNNNSDERYMCFWVGG